MRSAVAVSLLLLVSGSLMAALVPAAEGEAGSAEAGAGNEGGNETEGNQTELPPPPEVDPNLYTVAGIAGGWADDVQYAPTLRDTVYAIVRGSGLFRSSDDGATWVQLRLPTITEHTPYSLLLQANTPGHVWVGEGDEQGAPLWHSSDGGNTFTGIHFGKEYHHVTALGEGLGASEVWAGLQSHEGEGPGGALPVMLRHTTDGGLTWSSADFPGTDAITSIVQLASGRLVVGTDNIKGEGPPDNVQRHGGISYSDDGGQTWTTAVRDATLAIAQGQGTLMALTTDGAQTKHQVMMSTDGASWSVATTAAGFNHCLGNPNARATPEDPSCFARQSVWFGSVRYHATSDTFFALAAQKLLQTGPGPTYAWGTKDAAANVATTAELGTFAVDPDSERRILVTGTLAGDGVLRTVDGGASWAVSNQGLNAQEINFAIKDRGTGFRYAANNQGFIYASSGDIKRFTEIYHKRSDAPGTSSAPMNVVGLQFDHADPKRLLALFAWQESVLMVLDDASAAPADGAPYEHAAWRTVDLPNDLEAKRSCAVWANGDTWLVGACMSDGHGAGPFLYRSTDSGATWASVDIPVSGGIRSLVGDPSDPKTIYAGAGDWIGNNGATSQGNGLFRSRDGGATWEAVGTGTELSSQSPQRIVVDPSDPQRIWVLAHISSQGAFGYSGGYAYDLWESLDGGSSWTKSTPDLEDTSCRCRHTIFDLMYAPDEDKVILATGGMWGSARTNVAGLMESPGAGPRAWVPAFQVYGAARTLYSGSVGVGTSSGLYEVTKLGVDLPKEESDGLSSVIPSLGAAPLLASLATLALLARRRRG